MTSRVQGFIVSLENDMREDDAREIVKAISMLRGVLNVEPVRADEFGEVVTKARLRQEVLAALLPVFEGKKP